jgi:Na+/proline symporter
VFFGLGTGLYAFYKSHPDLLNINLTNDAIFPWFISQQLPVGVSGLVIAGLFAAAMSSLDSSMNSVSTALVTDFYRRFKRTVSEVFCLRLARWLTILMGAIGTGTALLMVTFQIQSLWDFFFKLLGLLGGSLAGIFALGVFTKKTHGVGTLVGALCSALILYFVQSFTKVHFFLYAAVGIISCFVIGYLISIIFPQYQKSKIDLFKS